MDIAGHLEAVEKDDYGHAAITVGGSILRMNGSYFDRNGQPIVCSVVLSIQYFYEVMFSIIVGIGKEFGYWF